MSTRTRLLLAIAYPLGVAIVSLAVPLALNVRDRVDAEVRNDAAAEAAVVAASAADHSEPDETTDLPALARRASRDARGRVVIVDVHGRLLADSSSSAPLGTSFANRPEIRSALGGRRVQFTRHSSTLGDDLLATAVPILHGGRPDGAVRLTQSMASVSSATRRATLGIAGLAAIVLGVGLAGAILLASQLSRSSRRMHDAALRVARGELDTRVPVEGATDQRELASAFNTMTDRVARLLTAQEALVADASHQLRTPLAGTRLQIEEVLHASDLDDARHCAATALGELDRLARTVDEMLVLSADGSAPTVRAEVDLDAVAAEAARRWSGPAGERRQAIVLAAAGGAVVHASEEDVTRALDALVENALRYSPDGASVTIATHGPRIEVLDRGPGIHPDEHDAVFARFHRGSAATGVRGSGLGLPIARQLARRNGGDVTVAQRTDGPGTRAVLEIGAHDA